jgi:hypothetical protein
MHYPEEEETWWKESMFPLINEQFLNDFSDERKNKMVSW